MTSGADSVTSLASGFGTYDAIVWTGGKVYRVTTEALNPVGDVEVEEIDDAAATKLMAA
jgi:hypothetical protein